MNTLVMILVAFVALQHLGFLALEMFFWTKPLGRKIFRTTESVAKDSAALAANQGLYNGFLAAGLIFSLLTSNETVAHSFQVFFLGCVIVAGVFGAATVSRRILFIQALPAAVTFALVLCCR